VIGSLRAASGHKLAATDEKDLSTAQSPTQTHPRIPGADGLAGWTGGAQAPPRQGTRAPGCDDPAEAARLKRPRESYGAADRLHQRREFLTLQKNGARYQTAHFVMYAGQLGPDERSRLGITVSRRIGGAVVRNRTKRRVRESYRRTFKWMLPEGLALVVIARDGAGDLDAAAVRDELSHAAAKLAARFKPRAP
jgi:ribonuclease P protein component